VSDLSILGVMDDDGDRWSSGGRDGRRQHNRRRGSGQGSGVLAVLIVLVLVGALGFGGKVLYDRAISTPDYQGDGTGTVDVQVRPGDTSRDIAVTLTRLGVVKSERAFNKAAAADESSRSIRPGFYRLHRQMSGAAALALLLDPSSRLNTKVTIPEGLSAREVYALLAKKTRVPVTQFVAAARNPQALGAPAGVRKIEGLLFPATYDFDPGTPAVDMLKEMVTTFNARVDLPTLTASGQARGLNWYQVLTIASLLEEEAITDDFGKVATVIDNRLAHGQRLGLDSTINYALGRSRIRVSEQDTFLDSPYNTYRHSGLTPTPIANPGLNAIEAAMKPTPGPWLYFVKINKDGHSYFTASYSDFLAHKQQAQANGIY
jgi:uncharacterized YceG family protein